MTARFQRITPFLWFNDQAEQAAQLYVSLFENSRITHVARYTKEVAQAAGRKEGDVMTVAFELDGQSFTAINGGPVFKLSEAFSLVVHCRSQQEIDHFWNGLTADGGAESQCGWLKDRYGLSWQIVPEELITLMTGPEQDKAARAMGAVMQMGKIDLEQIRKAAA
ncbi:VOC family protein [Dyella sp. LX-66]|uniref:VOC family protein n=1 Tax=unclassified Dyella TaxID=2634549 RepID=UPI001BE0337E|nr:MULTISPECIES: VOC family protein [unclassified Dyella]MBT2117971.1 VOC family protein [Dyella sp. LX-1]MBT2140878.1 VOC family protein [Dyella sp. LX-66]